MITNQMTYLVRIRFATIACLLALIHLLAISNSQAQTSYPANPITFVVGWPAGGPSDNVGRLIAAKLSVILGQSVVVDNRAGAGSNIGSDIVARAKPDGYTIMLATASSHGLNSALYPTLNFDPIKDFAPIGFITSSPSTLVVPIDSPIQNLEQLLQIAKANPGKLNYGSGGVGSSQHLAGAIFLKVANVDITHIPYKGTAPAMTDLMAGRVDMVLTTGVIPFVKSGKLRAIAVAAHQRLPALPDIPTFEELGVKGFYTDSWYGLVAPAGTPEPILETLNQALAKALQDPEVIKTFTEMGYLTPKPMGKDTFWNFVKQQMPEAAETVRISGAKLE